MPRSGRLNFNRKSWQSALWRALTTFDKSRIAPDVAVRNTIGIVIPLIVGPAAGHPSAGVVAAIGALNVSYSDGCEPYATRAARIFRASLLVWAAVTIGAICGNSQLTAIPAALAWAFGAGLLVVLGKQVGDPANMSLVTLLVFAARPMPPLEALESGLVAAAGGVLQMLLSVAFWPVRRYDPERHIVGSLYQTLAGTAVSPTGAGHAPPATAQIDESEQALKSLAQASLDQPQNDEAERYIFLLNQAERIRLSLLTLRRLEHRIEREPEGHDAAATLQEILHAASAVLASIGHAVIDRRAATSLGTSLDTLNGAVRRFPHPEAKTLPPLAAATIHDARRQIDLLAGQLRSASRTLQTSRAASGTAEFSASLRDTLRTTARLPRLRANLSFQSTAFRHAVRLAACVGLGEAISRNFSFQRTYWIPMTIAIVLRPDFSTTFTRGILRIAGTLAGLAVATGLFHALPAGSAMEIGLIVFFVFILRWAGPANYGVFVTALSAFIVLLIALTGVGPQQVIVARGTNTLIGGAIALLSYRVWPTWEFPQAGPVLANLIDAYRNYFHAVLQTYISGDESGLDRTRMKARLARSNAEALIGRIAAEPGVTRERSNLLSTILATSHDFVRSAMAIEAEYYGNRPKRVRPATVEFARQLETTLDAIAAALRTAKPLPPELPNLREAHNAILASAEPAQEQYTLIDTETDRMTVSLNSLREQVAALLLSNRSAVR